MKKLSCFPRYTPDASVMLISLTAAMLLGGCSQHVVDRHDERFPAPALVERTPPPTVKVHKASVKPQYRRYETLIARPSSPAERVAVAPANANQSGSAKQSTAGKPDSPAKTTSSEAPEPALPAADARPSSMGRRAYQDTPDTVAKPPAPNQQPSIGAIIEQAELNLRIGNVAAARAVLEPFVKTKHPEALAELGKTYDPIELEKFLVPAGTSNRAKAIELYTEATRLGSLVGKIRLDRLTSAPVPVEKQR